MIGTTVGKYRIIGQLGRGGTGMVYRAMDETLGREVAIKTLNPGLGETDLLRRFRAEATILARLNHPEIATIYELFRSETELLMVMELIRGETLEQLSSRLGPLPHARAAYLTDRILSALEHAHRAGVVHRDMKPANVMVTDLGGVKIMDFGVARIRDAEHMTIEGFVVGTPAYMAPEQVLAQEVDGRADLYSVGVTFYRLLTGRLPFTADTPAGLLHQQLAELPTPLRQHREDVPDWCEAVVQRALAKSPADRYQTAGEFRAALGGASRIGAADFDGSFAGAEGPAPAPPARTPTLVISPTEAGARAVDGLANCELPAQTGHDTASVYGVLAALAERARAGLPRTASARAGSLLAVFAVSVAVVAYLAPDKAETASARVTTAPASAKAFPALVFRTKALVGPTSRKRERDARLVLAEGTVSLTADDETGDLLQSIPYNGVIAVTYSHSTHPMWNGTKGPAVVARAPAGALSLLGISVERHWISMRTNTGNSFVILRVDESQVHRLLSALEERTDCAPQVVGLRKARK